MVTDGDQVTAQGLLAKLTLINLITRSSCPLREYNRFGWCDVNWCLFSNQVLQTELDTPTDSVKLFSKVQQCSAIYSYYLAVQKTHQVWQVATAGSTAIKRVVIIQWTGLLDLHIFGIYTFWDYFCYVFANQRPLAHRKSSIWGENLFLYNYLIMLNGLW